MSCDIQYVKPWKSSRMSSAHSPTFSSLRLRHSSSWNSSVALPTSQLILQPFRCFTYVTDLSPPLLSLLLRHRLFTYFTWRAAHAKKINRIRNFQVREELGIKSLKTKLKGQLKSFGHVIRMEGICMARHAVGFYLDKGSNYIELKKMCVCSNANPLHYYALRVPRKADTWR